MLQKCTSDNGVVLIVSPILENAGIPHAFSTRIGGVSRGAFASLNLGNPLDSAIRDSEQNIHENQRRLLSAIGVEDRQLCRVHQVHGRDLVTLRVGDAPPHHAKADALLTDNPELVLSMRTADCVPILAADKAGRFVAAIHAGWRGVVCGVVPETLAALHRLGVAPADMLLAIGPCISKDAFEVGDEVVADFVAQFGEHAPVIRHPDRKPHIDLKLAIELQALHFGLPPAHIDTNDYCTVRDAELFFSHRRESGVTGRMAAVISPVSR